MVPHNAKPKNLGKIKPAQPFPGKTTAMPTRKTPKVRKALSRVRRAYGSQKVSGPGISKGESKFYSTLAKKTGFSPRVLAAQGTQAGGADDDYNILNIGHTDSGSLSLTGGSEWSNPKSAAKSTAQFLKGEKYGASQGIQDILKSKGKSEGEQIAAIAKSGWATDPNYYAGISSIAPSIKAKPAKKPKAKDMKVLKEAGIKPKKAAAKEPQLKKAPGPWAGAQKAVLGKVPASVRPGRGDKRTPAENADVGGAANSDHLTTNEKS